jgi:hypothetical protein
MQQKFVLRVTASAVKIYRHKKCQVFTWHFFYNLRDITIRLLRFLNHLRILLDS